MKNPKQSSMTYPFLCALLCAVVAVLSLSAPVMADLYDDVEEMDKSKPPPVREPAQKAPPNESQSPTDLGTPLGKTPTIEVSPASEAPDTPPASQRTPPRQGNDSGKREPVHFESMGLQGLRSQGLVNLLDKVVVTQGDMRLEADKAVVHFDQKTEEVNRVVATGNVKIFRTDPETKQKVRAESNEVLFHNIERKVTLKGNARLWRGKDLVRGKQIVYELDTGWIKADRVEGVVQPSNVEEGEKPAPKTPKKAPTKSSGKGG